jgi:hypothetical protein
MAIQILALIWMIHLSKALLYPIRVTLRKKPQLPAIIRSNQG